jgi:hypothetical protein
MNEHLGRRKKETLCAEARGSAQGGGGGEEGIDSLPSPMVLAKFALVYYVCVCVCVFYGIVHAVSI